MSHEDTLPRGMFFTNYDYADSSTGPGKGLYSDMDKYKSVADFRKKKRKDKMRKRRTAFLNLISKASDESNLEDPTEDQVTPIPWNAAAPAGSPIGMFDSMSPEDEENNPITNLYYGKIETHNI